VVVETHYPVEIEQLNDELTWRKL